MKNWRFIISLSLAGFLVTPSASAERPLVAVLDFHEIRSGLASHEVELLADVARGEALKRLGGGYNIITRENLLDLLKAHGTDLAKCSGACETETGRLIGAELVVSGSIVKAFGAYKVNLKLHRTSPPELLGADVRTSQSLEGLEAQVRLATSAVLASLTASADRPARRESRPAPAPAPAAKAAPVSVRPKPASSKQGSGRSDAAPRSEPAAEVPVSGGIHLMADVGGLVFMGPSFTLEIGAKTRFAVWYRLISAGLMANTVAIDADEDSYNSAYGVGTGLRWYGRTLFGSEPVGLDGAWFAAGVELVETDVYNSYYNGQYLTTLLVPQASVGYRWGSSDWANQISVGLGLPFVLDRTVPEGADSEEGMAVYPVLTYEVEIF